MLKYRVRLGDDGKTKFESDDIEAAYKYAAEYSLAIFREGKLAWEDRDTGKQTVHFRSKWI